VLSQSIAQSATERFIFIRSLGEGGTGRVFEVEDREHGGRFALKQLRRDRTIDADRVSRFKDEFRALDRISHPNVARVFELISDASGLYVLMELIDGVDFVRHVHPDSPAGAPIPTASDNDESAPAPSPRIGTISVDRLRVALRQLVSGVLALHAANKIHCDVKPDNVLVTSKNRVVLVDFGLTSDLTRPTSHRPRRGTPAFMAPELFDGQVTDAADWYAVGVLLYFTLTGRLPFAGTHHAARSAPIDPRLLVRGAPEDLTDLALRLLRSKPEERPSTDAIARAVGLSQGSTVGLDSHFVGRDRELGALHEAYGTVGPEHPKVVHIHGESGIGKTSLVTHFTKSLQRRGVTVFRGACHAGATVPYKGIDSVVDAIAASLDLPSVALDVDDRAALTQLFPVFALGEGAPEHSASDPKVTRSRAVRALRAILLHAARNQPIVVCLDDFQWTDDEAVDLLVDVLRPPSCGALVVLSYRSTAADGQGDRWRRLLSALCPDAEFSLQPLDAEALGRLVDVSGEHLDPTDRDALIHESRGSPFFLGELLRSRSAGHPCGDRMLERTLSLRIAGLPPSSGSRSYLELITIAARPLDEEVLFKALRTSRPHALEARHELIASSFVRFAEVPGHVECYHDRIREHVLSTLSPEQASDCHAALATAYEAQTPIDPEPLALHYRAAGVVSKALFYAEAAGDAAARVLAFAHAAALYGAAIDMAGEDAPASLHVKHASTLSDAGSPGPAASAFLAALRHRPDDLDLRLSAGDELLKSGAIEPGLTILRSVARVIGEPIPLTYVGSMLTLISHSVRQVSAHRAILNDLDPSSASEQRRLTLCLVITKQLGMVDYLCGAVFQRRYLSAALSARSRVHVVRGLSLEAGLCSHMPRYIAGGIPRAEKLQARAHELCRPSDPADARGLVQFAKGLLTFAKGQWQLARVSFEEASAIFSEKTAVGRRWDIVYCRSFILLMQWLQGDVAGIRANLPECLSWASGNLTFEIIIQLRVGVHLALWDDNPDEAEELVREAMASWPASPWRLQHDFEAIALAEVELYRGHAEDAWRRIAVSSRRSRRAGIHVVDFFWLVLVMLRTRIGLTARRFADAERDIRSLERRTEGWAVALGHAFRSCLLASTGKPREAARLLERAIVGLQKWDLGLYVYAARWRLAELNSDAPGLEALLGELGDPRSVRAPERLVGSLLPWAR
jgi:hypothetical protein